MNISKSFLNCDSLNFFDLLNPAAGTAQNGSLSFNFTIFEDLNEIALKWSSMDSNESLNPWLSFDFQKNMLTTMPENVKVLYGCYSFGNELKGYFPIYFYDFSLDKSFREKNPVKRIFGKLIKVKICSE